MPVHRLAGGAEQLHQDEDQEQVVERFAHGLGYAVAEGGDQLVAGIAEQRQGGPDQHQADEAVDEVLGHAQSPAGQR